MVDLFFAFILSLKTKERKKLQRNSDTCILRYSIWSLDQILAWRVQMRTALYVQAVVYLH